MTRGSRVELSLPDAIVDSRITSGPSGSSCPSSWAIMTGLPAIANKPFFPEKAGELRHSRRADPGAPRQRLPGTTRGGQRRPGRPTGTAQDHEFLVMESIIESNARCNWLDQRGIFSRHGNSGWQLALVLIGFLIMIVALVPGARVGAHWRPAWSLARVRCRFGDRGGDYLLLRSRSAC